jgi:signal transduction histidine kinase/CheY-like chemotaxis protein
MSQKKVFQITVDSAIEGEIMRELESKGAVVRECSDSMFDNALSAFHSPIIIADSNSIISYTNKTSKSVFQELNIGMSVLSFLDRYFGKEISDACRNVISTGHSYSAEVEYGVKKYKMQISAILFDKGQTDVVLLRMYNVTEEKMYEAELKKSRARFKDLFTSMDIGAIILETNDQANSFIVRNVNYAAQDLDKLDNDTVVGKNILSVLPGIQNTELIDVLIKVWRVGGHEFIPSYYYKDASRAGWRECHIFKLSTGEIVFLYKDISDKLRAEHDLLKALEKAEESNRLKDAFLSSLSHEIRTPLNAIVGFANLLNDDRLDPEEKESYIDIISKNSGNLTRIIDDLLEVAELETTQLHFSKSELHLNDFLVNLYAEFDLLRKNRDVLFSLDNILPDGKDFILTDPAQLKKALYSLVDNALKFTHKGYVEFGVEVADNDMLLFYVKDSGIGIPVEKQDLIFDRFRQIDESSTRSYGGVGLGLSITKGIIEQMGGKIWLESTEGKGSVFYFTIPHESPLNQHEPVVFPGLVKEKLKNKAILIVDDLEESRFYLNMILKRLGAKLYFVEDGKQAIEVCKSDKEIDLILMDIQMPDIDGYETTKIIRSYREEVPVLALSAFGMYEDIEKAFAAGCVDFMSKPIQKNDLLKKISEIIN